MYIDKQRPAHHPVAIAHLMKESQPADYKNIRLNRACGQMFFQNHLPALSHLKIIKHLQMRDFCSYRQQQFLYKDICTICG